MAKVPVAEGASDKIYVRCNMGSVLSPAHYVSPQSMPSALVQLAS